MKTLDFRSALILAVAVVAFGVAQSSKKPNTLTGSTPITTDTQFPGWMLDSAFKPEPRVIKVAIEPASISIEYARDFMPTAIPAVICPYCDWTIHERWRDIYGVKDGRLALLKTERGIYVPAKTEPASVVWGVEQK